MTDTSLAQETGVVPAEPELAIEPEARAASRTRDRCVDASAPRSLEDRISAFTMAIFAAGQAPSS